MLTRGGMKVVELFSKVIPASKWLPVIHIVRNCSCPTLSVAEALKETHVGKKIRVQGWIRAFRNQKEHSFFNLCDGTSFHHLQVVACSSNIPKDASFGSSVEVVGNLVNSTHPGQTVELLSEKTVVLGTCDLTEYPIHARQHLHPNYTRNFLHLRCRSRTFSSIFRIRSTATFLIHEYFRKQGFVFINTPFITSNDCEGAGEVFEVQAMKQRKNQTTAIDSKNELVEENFFNKDVYLTVSGQLHLESMACALSNVYTFGPTFRAENSRSRQHLSEFHMIEAEMAFISSVEKLTQFLEKFVKWLTAEILSKHPEDIKWLHQHSEYKVHLENIITKDFVRITYSEALLLLKTFDDLQPLKWGEDLSKIHEQHLVKQFGEVPLFVTHFPKSLKPFYMRECDSEPLTVECMDLLFPIAGEICGGSVREFRYDKLKTDIERLNHVQALQWYLDLRKYGSVEHAGFGLGFERYLQSILGVYNIKDVIPFPRWPHHCSL